ncbi:MAG: DUF3168 domain-containing protein [Pseudomonadota bacterium]
MVGLQRLVRRALLAKLKANAALTALVPAASINPLGEPQWPFIVLRSPVTQRLRATGVVGGVVSWDVHAFAGPLLIDGAMTQTAEDHAGLIGAAIETALADNRIALTTGGNFRVRLGDMRLLPDDTPAAYHWFAQCDCRVITA